LPSAFLHNGRYIGWYESGKRKAKALPGKELAEHYKQIKYTQLNSDVFTGQVLANWHQMVEEYCHSKTVGDVTEPSLYETALTLRHFERLIGKCNSKQITQHSIADIIQTIRSVLAREARTKIHPAFTRALTKCLKKYSYLLAALSVPGFPSCSHIFHIWSSLHTAASERSLPSFGSGGVWVPWWAKLSTQRCKFPPLLLHIVNDFIKISGPFFRI
jgi:hypothetical protein